VWLFNWAFVSTAATIVSGAVAERIHFHCYIVFVFFLSLLVYPAVVHWTWSDDGFMSPRRGENLLYGCGVVDFAGSGVVHCTGGMCALVALFLLGPRDGVTFVNGARKAPPGQSPSFQTLGTLALWFGWFGFNGCSTGVLVGSAHVAARAMLNTALGGATGGVTSAVLSVYGTRKQLAVTSTLNGILAGLVGVTANCATVQMEGAFAIGAVSGCIYHFGARLLVRLQVDDVVQAVPVHLFAGMWGILAAGFFTVPKLYGAAYAHDEGMERRHECAGLLYGGSGKQLGAQLTFLVVALTWVLVTAGSLFYVFHLRKVRKRAVGSSQVKGSHVTLTLMPLSFVCDSRSITLFIII
jgi:Amt family ammonium transporter